MVNVEIKAVDSWPEDEIVALYKAGGWWKDHYDSLGVQKLIAGSFIFAVAVDEDTGHAVGMGRVISDGVSDGYIQDVVVLPELRGKGIGSMIVKELKEMCLDRGLVWIGLIAEKGSNDFYRPMGFRDFPGEPMVFEPEG